MYFGHKHVELLLQLLHYWKKLILGSINNEVDLIRRLGSDPSPHQRF